MAKKKQINTAWIEAKIDLINTHYGLDFHFGYGDMKTVSEVTGLPLKTKGGNYRITANNRSYEITKGSKPDIDNCLNGIIRTIELIKFNGRSK